MMNGYPPRTTHDHDSLIKVVRSVRNRWRVRILLRGIALLLLSALALTLLAGYVIDLSRFDATTVTWVRTLAYLALAAVFLRMLVWPLLRRVSDERVALYLEEHEPSLGGRLISAVELGREHDATTSSALVEQLVRSAVEACRKVEDGRRVERTALWRSSGLVAGSTVFGFGVVLLGPAFLKYTTPVLFDPWTEAEVANPYRIRVQPGDTTLAKGSDLKVTAELENFDAAEVELAVRSGEGDWTRWSMLNEGESYTLMVFDLYEATEYFVEASGVRSAVHKVEVKELPYVEDIHLTYHFPAYTGLDPMEQPGSGDIAALVGTEVRLVVVPTFPVPGGAIELVGGKGKTGETDSTGKTGETESTGTDVLPLTVNDDGRLSGSITVREPGTYRILLDGAAASEGQRVVASPDYVIDPLSDQPPLITLSRPRRDMQVTSLEEVTTEIRAQDDYGVSRVELLYSVNGGEEQTATLYQATPGRKDFVGTRTLFLEDYELQPGDLLAYYGRAVDGRPSADESRETVSDIYFLEIRPFDRNFRQADSAGGGMQGGGNGEELAAQQRMIIAATFKLARGRRSREPAEDRAEDIATIAMSQGRLRGDVVGLLERMAGQGIGAGDSAITEALPLALEAMTEAEEALGEHRPEAAFAPEQKALQYLQRVAAAVRDIQVARGQQGGGGGGGQINEELLDLFEMEMDELRNQYEQVQRGQQKNVDDAIDETLEKLRELARRQQQENERMRARSRQARGTRTGSSGKTQRELAQETEEVARKLERLAREESLPDLAETARRLREAAEEMRRAAASGERTGEAVGNSALDQLRQARRQLERNKSGRLDRDIRNARKRTDRLRREQQSMVDRVERLSPTDAGYEEALRELMRAKERMGAEVGSLEAELDQLARDFQRDQPEASRRLQEAVGEIRDNKIREKILYSRGVVQQRSKAYARNFEEHIEKTLEQLGERLREAAGAIGESPEQRLRQALEETREVATALEAVGERVREGGQIQPGQVRQLDRELDRRRFQLEGLRGRLVREGVDTTDLERVIDRLRGLEAETFARPETLALLEQEVVQGLKEFEYSLRRSLRATGDERSLQVGDDDVPEGYEEMVEKYYKALAGGERALAGGEP